MGYLTTANKKRSYKVAVSPRKKNGDKDKNNEKENEPEPLLKQPKQTKASKSKHKFAPTNNLNNSNSNISNIPLKQVQIDSNIPKERNTTTPSKHLFGNYQHQSPSSEDDVYWQSTPKLKSNAVPANRSSELKGQLPSSPLEEISPLNPISNLPQKYQTINFDNFSQRYPETSKQKSLLQIKSESFPPTDFKRNLSSSVKPKKFLNPFSITNTPNSLSSKKKDITDLINTVESAFSSTDPKQQPDIFKLRGISDETPSKIKEEFIPKIPNTPFSEIKTHIERKTGPLKFELSSDILDDDFSDDFMNDLDKILEKKSTQTQTLTLGEDRAQLLDDVTANLAKEKIIEEHDDASITDSFDDDFDDDMIDQLLNKKPTQAPVTQLSNSLAKETTFERVHREGHLIFKKDIDGENVAAVKRTDDDTNRAKWAVDREGVYRYQVLEVLENSYGATNNKKTQKIVTVIDSKNQTKKIVVRDIWCRLDLQPKDVIHIVGKNDNVIDKNSDNLLIWNPDLLLSATLIGDTINCDRRSVLKTRLDFRGEYSKPLIVGEIVHSIFQAVLKERNCSMKFIESVLEEEMDLRNLTILSIEESKETIREEVKLHTEYIKSWYELYVKENKSNLSSIKISSKREKTLFATSNILDIEENIWSPMFGLRGMIDVTIEAYLRGTQNEGKFIAPLELKSGARPQLAHKAQAALYTLLMRDRYDTDVEFMMLVYTKFKETTKFELDKKELKDIIMLRNQVSKYLKEGYRSLPPLKQDSTCDDCFAIDACMTYNNLAEGGTAETSGLLDGVYDDLTSHLDNPEYSKFFNYWDNLITKEEGTMNILKKDLFLIDGETREKSSGKCLSRLVIKNSSEDMDAGTDSNFMYTFIRKNKDLPSFEGTQLSRFDRILVSDESGHYALCSGFVQQIHSNEIVISTNRRLKNHNLKIDGFNMKNNQTYQSFLRPLDTTQDINESITYRIDKDEMFHGMKLARYNILNLFLKDGDQKRRDLIVTKVPPKFKPKPLKYALEKNHTFNEDQIKAFDKVLSAEDVSLILGMPGTGKTTVIAQLIRILVKHKKTVLLTSYTHSAVDNILMKIKNDDIGIIRLGHINKIHPEVREFSPESREIKTNRDLHDVFMNPPVVATTCLGISHWLFNRRKFDYCIVDESSQVSMPVCIGPLAFSDKFVLVGDHFQLPPLVQNQEAKVGLSRSLFKMLSEDFPETVIDLAHQYRMCSDIMLLSNTIIYEGRLKCGSEAVANQSLIIPNIESLTKFITMDNITPEQNWLETVLDPTRKVLFLNHDNVGECEETSLKENISNTKEALLIYQIAAAMLSCGIREESIGIMSFYRGQLRVINKMFSERKGIERLTADQFQGRDKDCVIISLVKSNAQNDAGSLLKEWRRVNVAITRARSKLIIVGSKSTLESLKTIDAFMKILSSRGWFYNLPPKADTFYSFSPPAKSQLSTVTSVKSFKESKIIQKSSLAREIGEEL